jgi:hypothetical protein
VPPTRSEADSGGRLPQAGYFVFEAFA